ncbi:MAG: hypothetical protein KF760_00690 [Candidatus Eremiobacteraeota bacterium]|nr:hypothetical protein [Candidatus Eremiobacteraeota bacterium]MCW5871607.1 hypothetical protein [Candidatus Eremiobacteraeota bacterium]
MAIGNITNFNQQAMDQQMFLMDRMRVVCPGTAAIGENLTTRPVYSGNMFYDDQANAASSQGLTNLLGQACAIEASGGGVPQQFPSFLLR